MKSRLLNVHHATTLMQIFRHIFCRIELQSKLLYFAVSVKCYTRPMLCGHISTASEAFIATNQRKTVVKRTRKQKQHREDMT